MTLNGLSLCAGAGGVDIALHILTDRYRCVGYVEREAYAASTLVARMEDKALDPAPVWDDVTTFDGTEWRGCVDIITAGYPCQPFSVAGRKRGADDERHLWPHIHRIIGEVSPPLVLLENVANHLRIGFDVVRAELRAMDYQVAAGLFSAAEVGAPHGRARLFVLAYRPSGGFGIVRESSGRNGFTDRRDLELGNAGECRLDRNTRRGAVGVDHCPRREEPEGSGQDGRQGIQRPVGRCDTLEQGRGLADSEGLEGSVHPRQGEEGRREIITDRASGNVLGTELADTCSSGLEGGDNGEGVTGRSEPDGSTRPSSGTLSDPDSRDVWKLPERSEPNEAERGNAFDGDNGLYGKIPLFPPRPSETGRWARVLEEVPQVEPAFCRVADVVADRVDSLRLTGNGVDPIQAAVAVVSLWLELVMGEKE